MCFTRAGASPIGVNFSTAVILSRAKDLCSARREILRCAQDDRWLAELAPALALLLYYTILVSFACLLLQVIQFANGFDRGQLVDGELLEFFNRGVLLGGEKRHL